MPTKLSTDASIAEPITCIISDVDGVMTDGRIVYDDHGVETKRFHVRDGLGIKLWMRSGFAFAILSARQGNAVKKRAAELGIEHVAQGFEKKWPAAESLFDAIGCRPEQVCYIGDDLPDIAVMKRVALAVSPADAATDARDAAHWVLQKQGGEGAVRELVERLLRAKGVWQDHLDLN